MSINKFRGFLYALAKILGDIQAIQSPRPGAIERRIKRRLLGKIMGRIMGKIK